MKQAQQTQGNSARPGHWVALHLQGEGCSFPLGFRRVPLTGMFHDPLQGRWVQRGGGHSDHPASAVLSKTFSLKHPICGAPAVAQQDPKGFGSTGMWAGSPAQHCSCGLGLDCGLDLTLGPGAAYAVGWPKMKHKQNPICPGAMVWGHVS